MELRRGRPPARLPPCTPHRNAVHCPAPVPPLAEEVLNATLAAASRYAAEAAAGDVAAAANITDPPGVNVDVDMLVLLTVGWSGVHVVWWGVLGLQCGMAWSGGAGRDKARGCLSFCGVGVPPVQWAWQEGVPPPQPPPRDPQVVALREGGRLGALGAANATTWGAGTRYGPRDSYQRCGHDLMQGWG